MSQPYRAVFFDLGGTLFSNRAIPKVTMPFLMEAGLRLAPAATPEQIGRGYVKAASHVNQDFVDRPFYLHRDLFEATYHAWAEGLGARIDDAFVDWLYEGQRRVMVEEMRLRKDCLATLDALRERGLSLSIVSNIDDDYLHPMLDSMALRPRFDHWSSSEEARACKPDRAFFQYALDKAGMGSEEVLFVGDSRVHDIQGANRMGMHCALLSEEKGASPLEVPDVDARPTYEIGSLSDLLEIVPDRAR